MTKSVACWFDYSSPFAYLGVTQIERVAAEAGAEVEFRPFLLGALFKSIGTPLVPLSTFPPAKVVHQRRDLARWADVYGVPFRFTSTFPLNTVHPLRLTLVAPAEHRSALIHRLMRAAWADDEDIGQPEVLARCARDVGLDEGLLERTREPAVKQALRDATDAALEAGCPGAPSFVVEGELYWGQDRLDFVARALRGDPPGV